MSQQNKGRGFGHARGSKLPSSFTSSYRIHEILMGDSDLPTTVTGKSSRWIICFLVIQFDVDIGPDLKIIRPSIQFNEDDFKTICFSSLPERSGNQKTTQFHTFRFNSYTFGNQELFGYSLFTQQKDYSVNRGYLQESLVILSHHNFPRLFEKCLTGILQHERFLGCPLEHKIPCLDNAIYNIAAWPNPEPSATLEIGFMGDVFNVIVPYNDYTPLVGYNKTSANEISSSEPVGSWNFLLQYFNDLNELYVLYEYAILGKPLIIYSISPRLCSTLISNLIDLIRPVPYSERIREYVTIHSCPEDLANGMTGITNPVLVHPGMEAYVFLLTKKPTKGNNGSGAGNKWAAKLLRTNNNTSGGMEDESAADISLYKEEIDKLRTSVRSTNKELVRNRALIPDNKFISSLSQLVNSNSPNIDYAVRFHFATLTSKLIAPLSVYLIPSPAGSGLIFNQLDFVNDLSNDDAWDEPVEPLKTYEEQHQVANSGNTVWHTLQRMGSKASLFSQQSMGIKFVNSNSSGISKQTFYHQVLQSRNFKAWLKSNGVDDN